MEITSILKLIVWKIKYFGKLKINITRHIRKGARIKINNGKIIIGRGLGLNYNSQISANGGNIEIGKGVNFNVNCICVSPFPFQMFLHIGVNFNVNCICVSHNFIKIEDKCSFGPNVCIYDHDHAFDENGKVPGKFKNEDVFIGENVWVGANTVILRGTKIGKNSIIGAGCIVKGEVPNNSIVTMDRKLIIKKLEKKRKNINEN